MVEDIVQRASKPQMEKIQEDTQEKAHEASHEALPVETKHAWAAQTGNPADEKDIAIYKLVEDHLVNENNLKQVYNDYRKSKGMEPVDFIKSPHDQVTIQHCMDFLLTCVKDQPDGLALDEFKGQLFDGIGMNNHKGRRYNDEL